MPHAVSQEIKSQIVDAAKKLSPIQASKNTHDDEAATSWNLHSLPEDSSELITLNDARWNSTRLQWYVHCL